MWRGPLQLTSWMRRDEGDQVVHLIQLERSSIEEGVSQRRLTAVISDEGVVLEVGAMLACTRHLLK
jgi:hypothetical protein